METEEQILKECARRLAVAAGLKHGQSKVYRIRAIGPSVVISKKKRNALLAMTVVEFFTRERLERAAKELGLESKKRAIGYAFNMFAKTLANRHMTMETLLTEVPSTKKLAEQPYIGFDSVAIIVKAVNDSGLEMVDDAYYPKR